MTTQVLIVATTGDDPFAVRRGASQEPVGQRMLTTVYAPSPAAAATRPADDGALDVVRTAHGQGFVANLGPRFVHVHYLHDGCEVGPRLDLLAPGAIRELGMGPDVVWRIREVE